MSSRAQPAAPSRPPSPTEAVTLDEQALACLRRVGSLSERELSVAKQVATGVPLKIIASDLSISVQAVSTYLSRACKKLAVAHRVDLAAVVFGPALRFWNGRPVALENLTQAEWAIWEAVVSGSSNAALACRRGTSVRTIENQVSALMHKVGVRSRAELAGLPFRK
jgi:DNA-binding NarL/FixJ family response regulator